MCSPHPDNPRIERAAQGRYSCHRLVAPPNWHLLLSRRQRHGDCRGRVGRSQKHGAPARNDSRTAYLVVRICAGSAAILQDGIRAIECVVEASPARVCGIQGISRVGERHDELGPGNYRDLVIDISCSDNKIVFFRHNIADVTQKPLVVTQIKWLVGVLLMILIDSGLELVPNLEQLAIAWAAVAQQLGKAAPERFRRGARSRSGLLFDELMQRLGYPQTADPD